MAMRPMRLCSYPGCSALVESGRCEKHAKQDRKEYDRQRGSFRERGYSFEWDKARKLYLSKNPLCEICATKNKIVQSVLVHHKVPITEGGALLDYNNLQALCNNCHENIHGKDRFKRKV